MKLGYDSTSSGGELSLVLFLIDLLALALYSPFALIFVAIKSHEYSPESHDCFFIVTSYLPKDKVNRSVLYFTPGVLPMN